MIRVVIVQCMRQHQRRPELPENGDHLPPRLGRIGQFPIGKFAREPNGGLLVLPDTTTRTHRQLITALAAQYRVPAIYDLRDIVVEGGLISYGVDVADLIRRAAGYVDRVLKGAKPAELPVQLPTKFELVINLKTAKGLGLDVPLLLQQRADEIVE